ncbi:MAG: hypothetical protein HC869_07695 [Rhodospirillales bacterium]|nr:hypothetical protein [Rhodospirillales bacterium]
MYELIMRRRSGLMGISRIKVLPSRGEVPTPQASRPSTSPVSSNRLAPTYHSSPNPAQRVRPMTHSGTIQSLDGLARGQKSGMGQTFGALGTVP